MKKILLLATVVCYTSIAALAQHDHNSHQNKDTSLKKDTSTKATVIDESSQQRLSQLLSSYYNIKNALVTGDANSAASNAGLFLKTANAIDFKVISEGNVHILSKDAGKISSTKDLKKQREYFADLSSNMATVAKSLKLGNLPIYLQYCPMKKAAWLSSEKQIRNPYYGSSMLTCGEVTETL
ncbi:MAG: DUF3347 domain-containing protein [Ferruginibacter sp.]